MLFDKEEFARKVKTHVGGATRDEQSTTIQTLCEYIVRESLFDFMELIEPVLSKAAKQNEDIDRLENRINDLENNNRFLMGLIGFNKDNNNGEDGRHENAKRSPKATRQTA